MAKRKAEMWDKMQYLFRNYYDRMIHIACRVKGKIDYDAMVKALDILVYKVDILRCSFSANPLFPHWTLHKDFDVKDIVRVIRAENLEAAIDESLCGYIPAESKFQLRVTLIETDGEESAVTVLLNHMCADGGDSKYLMSKLTELYADIVNGGDGTRVQLKQGRRDALQLYDRMPPEKAKRAKKLFKNISQSKINVEFPFAPPAETDENRVRIFRVRWEESFVAEINAARKKCNATMNDILLAAFFRKLYDYMEGKHKHLNIISMMDLRRYCGGETLGVTNMTGFAPCDIEVEKESFLSTLSKVKKRMEQNKLDEFMGLYSLPLLKLAFTVFPHFISEIAIKIGYQNPLIGMSNIGILDTDKYSFAKTELLDCFMTGAAKYKPYMQLTTTTFLNTMTFCIAEKCSERDGYILSQFLRDYRKELENFIAEVNAE